MAEHMNRPFSLDAPALGGKALSGESRAADRQPWLSPWIGHDGTSARRIVFWLGPADNDQARESVITALEAGYRHLDTAPIYGHEKGVGWAVKAAEDDLGLPREEIFVGTKLPQNSQGYEAALKAGEKSLARLGLDWIDLLLINWSTSHQELHLEAWKAMARLKRDGLARAIGVVNCTPGQVDLLAAETGERPAVNQLEINPYHQGCDICLAMEQRAVPVEARSPFGGLSLSDPLFMKLAVKHGRTPAQIVLRWHLECGRGAVPKAADQRSMRENLNVFNFRLDVEDMRRIALLNRGGALGLKGAVQ